MLRGVHFTDFHKRVPANRDGSTQSLPCWQLSSEITWNLKKLPPAYDQTRTFCCDFDFSNAGSQDVRSLT